MKAAPFAFVRAETLEHALEQLAQHGDAKLIAGGQSLVPMMAMRLARPAVLVDINRLPGLKTLQFGRRHVVVGATTRQRDMEENTALRQAVPLLGEALRWVGHVQTRNRGTVGGSLVHADPSAELPLAAAVLDAELVLHSQAGGQRRVAAADFFIAPMFTATAEAECLTAVEWPVWEGPGVSCAFEETAIRHGDFAMASAACQLQFDDGGTCRRAGIGLGAVAGTPLAFPDLAAELVGHRMNTRLARDIAEAAAERADPGSDMHADAEYRRHLAAVLLRRALLRAADAAGGAPALAA